MSPSTPAEERRKEWHLDYRITLTMIMVLVVNTGSLIWWAAELAGDVESLNGVPARVYVLEKEVIRLQEHDKLMDGILGELKTTTAQMNDLILKFGNEQSRRTPIVNRAEIELFGGRHRGQ